MVSKEKSKIHLILPSDVFHLIEQAVSDIGFGSVTLIVQDRKIIQIEKLDKIRVGDKQAAPVSGNSSELLRNKILEAMEEMSYGQVMIIIKNRRIIQIERTEKQRFNSLEGLYGDGI